MGLRELLEKKSNIFHHIIYEFDMYLETYFRLLMLLQNKDKDTIMKNVLLESHAVHLRNLIEFFNCEDDCISTKSIFIGNIDLSYDDMKYKAKQVINKTIDHLTKERYTWNQTDKDLTFQYGILIHKMFAEIMLHRIIKCLDLLVQGDQVRPELIDALHNDEIQRELKNVVDFCNVLRGVKQ